MRQFTKVVGHHELAGKLANVAIGVALTAFTYLLSKRVAGEAVALTSGLMIAVWPNLIFHTGILSSDFLAAAGFVAVMWLGVRDDGSRGLRLVRTVILGALLGWMVLVRPVSLILLASLGLWWWITAHSFIGAVARVPPVAAIVALLIGAWTIRNYATFGEVVVISTNGGYNFWQTNHRYADGNDTFWPFVPMDDPEYQTMWYGDEFTKNREAYRYALDYLAKHPTHLLTMLPTKLFWLYHSDTSGFYEGALFPPMGWPSPVADWIGQHDRLVEAVTFRYYEILMGLAVVGALVAVFVLRAPWIWPILSMPLLLTTFHVFFHAKDRFHMPLDSLISVLAAVTLFEGFRRVRRWAGQVLRRSPAAASA